MKYSKTVVSGQWSVDRRAKFFFPLLLFIVFIIPSYSNENALSLKAPIQENEPEENLPSQIKLSIIPNFPRIGGSIEGRRISVSDTTIPLNTSLKIIVNNYIDSKTATIGDYFKAHVLEDFYISTDPPQLVLPKGSWIRGRISFLKRPNFFIKTGKIGLHLNQLVTPLGETVVLDAELDVQKGIISEGGLLKPSVIKQTDSQILFDKNLPVSINNLGSSLIGDLLTGKLYALLTQSDTTALSKGQELQIVLQRNVQLREN